MANNIFNKDIVRKGKTKIHRITIKAKLKSISKGLPSSNHRGGTFKILKWEVPTVNGKEYWHTYVYSTMRNNKKVQKFLNAVRIGDLIDITPHVGNGLTFEEKMIGNDLSRLIDPDYLSEDSIEPQQFELLFERV